MELQTAIEILEYHQKWRLGKREDMIHEPKKLTEALDIVINEVKMRIMVQIYKVSEKLPKAQSLEGTSGTYYLITVKGYGQLLAMYLENEAGEKDWYKDYTSKIIREVVSWTKVVVE